MKPMNKIVLSAIAALVVTVGVYHIAFLKGASEPAAVAAAVAVDLVFAAVTAFAFAAVAAAVAFATFAAVTFATFVVAVTFVAVTVVVAVRAAVAEQKRIRFICMAPAYTVVTLATWGALAVGSASWSAAIALGGIAVLIALPSKAVALERNGA